MKYYETLAGIVCYPFLLSALWGLISDFQLT